ncbi:SulP family inorganic anion transporter [Actinomadura sp. ATCC 31491]|uniref:carbonic anhydrase n=1 Tax=Actinomadura luzonensis TaxID=2805427 RepID=A0ABT0FK36_9ACTN|nr:SulP family inorganic anion transporter [Actinomadura luzonensis]MCK2212341.1 SulP family inorganic anion transporter [Actinomadura luzonensis]
MATLRFDLAASLVVVLVAVPLSLGVAMASGAPLAAGLIAAAVGGIVAGRLGGSPVQVSGPTASLTVVVAGLVQTYGWRATCLITVLAGVVQVLLGALRTARAALAVSPAVVHGMLAGVGVIIALSQLHVVLGGSPQYSALANLIQLPGQMLDMHGHKVMVGVLAITVLLVWGRLPKPVQALPAPLAALLVAAGTAWLFRWDVTRIDLSGAVTAWAPPELPHGDWHQLAVAVLLVALLAGAESLLCCVATDGMHTGPRADLDRELSAQGVANMTSGLLGGLPVAGVIVRSTTNIRAGARTRWSAVLHGVWVLLFALCLGWTIKLIPIEALAALLVFIGVRTISLGHLKKVHGHHEVPVYVLTMAGVVLVGLAEGVLGGIALAALLALRRLTRVTVTKDAEPGGGVRATVSGSLTFLSVPRLTQELRAIPAGTAVLLDLNIDFMDNAAFEAVHSWRLDHERLGGTVTIDELHDEWYAMAASGRRVSRAKTPPRLTGRWRLPRPPRRPGESAGGEAHPLAPGAEESHRSTAPLGRPHAAAEPARNQPAHLFITCADSRVAPDLIAGGGPGELFVVRNVGNLVPRAEPGAPADFADAFADDFADDSVAAAVEYATRVLKVHTITVCGHSGCGAMAALLSGPAATAQLPRLHRWLRHGESGLGGLGDGGPEAMLDELGRRNVRRQLDNLMTCPGVAEQVGDGRLKLVGLYYDVASAQAHVVPPPLPDAPGTDAEPSPR